MRYAEIVDRTEKDTDWFDSEILWEDFTQPAKPGSRPGSLKKKAAHYLGADKVGAKLTRGVIRQLLAKAKKMRNSTKKAERTRGTQLTKQANWYLNFHKK